MLRLLSESIANVRNGEDKRRAARVKFDLLAQAADVNVDRATDLKPMQFSG